jgi:hypothetical protein
VPTWSAEDLASFSMARWERKFFPSRCCALSSKSTPDLFPTSDLTHLGLIPDQEFGWPIGSVARPRSNIWAIFRPSGSTALPAMSRRSLRTEGSEPIRILGTTSDFNVEAFFGSVLGATVQDHRPGEHEKVSRRLPRRETGGVRRSLGEAGGKRSSPR